MANPELNINTSRGTSQLIDSIGIGTNSVKTEKREEKEELNLMICLKNW